MSTEAVTASDQRLQGLRDRALQAKEAVEAKEKEMYGVLRSYILEGDEHNVNPERSVTQVEGIYQPIHQNNGASGEWVAILLCDVPFSTKGDKSMPKERAREVAGDCLVSMGIDGKGDYSDVAYTIYVEKMIDGKMQLVQEKSTIDEFEARFQTLIGRQVQKADQLGREADILRVEPVSTSVLQSSDALSQPVKSNLNQASSQNMSTAKGSSPIVQ